MSESVVFESVESFMFRSSLLVLVVVESGSKIRSFQFLRKVPSSVASSYDRWSADLSVTALVRNPDGISWTEG